MSDVKEQAELVLNYVYSSLEDDISIMMDDPAGVFQGMSEEEIANWLKDIVRLCSFVGTTLHTLMVSCAGSETEYNRLSAIINNLNIEVE